MQEDLKEVSSIVLDAIGEFAMKDEPKHLRLVRLVIFHEHMLDTFKQGLARKLEETRSGSGSGRHMWRHGIVTGCMLLCSYNSLASSAFQFFSGSSGIQEYTPVYTRRARP